MMLYFRLPLLAAALISLLTCPVIAGVCDDLQTITDNAQNKFDDWKGKPFTKRSTSWFYSTYLLPGGVRRCTISFGRKLRKYDCSWAFQNHEQMNRAREQLAANLRSCEIRKYSDFTENNSELRDDQGISRYVTFRYKVPDTKKYTVIANVEVSSAAIKDDTGEYFYHVDFIMGFQTK